MLSNSSLELAVSTSKIQLIGLNFFKNLKNCALMRFS